MISGFIFAVIVYLPQYLVLLLDTLYLGASINWLVGAGMLTSYFGLSASFANLAGSEMNRAYTQSKGKLHFCFMIFAIIIIFGVAQGIPFLIGIAPFLDNLADE